MTKTKIREEIEKIALEVSEDEWGLTVTVHYNKLIDLFRSWALGCLPKLTRSGNGNFYVDGQNVTKEEFEREEEIRKRIEEAIKDEN